MNAICIVYSHILSVIYMHSSTNPTLISTIYTETDTWVRVHTMHAKMYGHLPGGSWLCVGQYLQVLVSDTPSLLNLFLKNLYGQILANTFKITTRMDKRKVHFKKFFSSLFCLLSTCFTKQLVESYYSLLYTWDTKGLQLFRVKCRGACFMCCLTTT